MIQSIHENVVLVREGPEVRFACAWCRADLGPAAESYRDYTIVAERPIGALGERLYGGMESSLDEQIVFRTYGCPGCGARLDAEVCPHSAEPLRDIELSEFSSREGK
jgi:hypothetical protein